MSHLYIEFADKCVSYETFLEDISNRIANKMRVTQTPEYISQRKAYNLFGRSNVERWRKQGKVQFCKRPGKIEYPIMELKRLQLVQQDYFV